MPISTRLLMLKLMRLTVQLFLEREKEYLNLSRNRMCILLLVSRKSARKISLKTLLIQKSAFFFRQSWKLSNTTCHNYSNLGYRLTDVFKALLVFGIRFIATYQRQLHLQMFYFFLCFFLHFVSISLLYHQRNDNLNKQLEMVGNSMKP